ncbi:hypothetical protein EJ06DRAFT_308512 [Trichodelitschia bisporula]|uniref:Uncharacterized protein n=1 Tax=Trichodelitschia bisporula TaxID=703511 RepID=A0A6G1I3J9_9PEZI|nr:hypothetical protein EJ06DRAFT_308512 [Trichodelitschia bisporula]
MPSRRSPLGGLSTQSSNSPQPFLFLFSSRSPLVVFILLFSNRFQQATIPITHHPLPTTLVEMAPVTRLQARIAAQAPAHAIASGVADPGVPSPTGGRLPSERLARFEPSKVVKRAKTTGSAVKPTRKLTVVADKAQPKMEARAIPKASVPKNEHASTQPTVVAGSAFSVALQTTTGLPQAPLTAAPVHRVRQSRRIRGDAPSPVLPPVPSPVPTPAQSPAPKAWLRIKAKKAPSWECPELDSPCRRARSQALRQRVAEHQRVAPLPASRKRKCVAVQGDATSAAPARKHARIHSPSHWGMPHTPDMAAFNVEVVGTEHQSPASAEGSSAGPAAVSSTRKRAADPFAAVGEAPSKRVRFVPEESLGIRESTPRWSGSPHQGVPLNNLRDTLEAFMAEEEENPDATQDHVEIKQEGESPPPFGSPTYPEYSSKHSSSPEPSSPEIKEEPSSPPQFGSPTYPDYPSEEDSPGSVSPTYPDYPSEEDSSPFVSPTYPGYPSEEDTLDWETFTEMDGAHFHDSDAIPGTPEDVRPSELIFDQPYTFQNRMDHARYQGYSYNHGQGSVGYFPPLPQPVYIDDHEDEDEEPESTPPPDVLADVRRLGLPDAFAYNDVERRLAWEAAEAE